MRLNLTDNSTSEQYSRKDISVLFAFEGKSIAELCRENENILVFPYSIELSDDRIGESTILNIVNTTDPEQVQIATGNVMGFIGIGDLQIKIQSRFDKGRDDYFLHYMLQRVMSFNIFDLSHNNEQEDVFDFVMFMFPYFLKNAMRQGLYREYQNFRHNDANIKGTIDIGRHIARNIPFMGNVAYNTREYSQDNSMTELIRHTIEFMKTKKYGAAVLNIDRDTIDNVNTIIGHTPSYNKNNRSCIISKNLRRRSHPYYTEYIALQSLCLQILRMEEVKYGESDDEICGILFDGAWLWEEYINTILGQLGFDHPENKKGKGSIWLFDDIDEEDTHHYSGRRYPDFYKDDYVLDAKYKWLEKCTRVSEVERDDIHQVITYMTNLKVDRGGFIAPLTNKQTAVPTSTLKDSSATLSIHGVEISKTASSYSEFCEEMKEMEEQFVKSLRI